MRIKPTLDRLEREIVGANRIVDWEDLRDAVDITLGGQVGPKTLDRYTQLLVNRMHKSASHLLARE